MTAAVCTKTAVIINGSPRKNGSTAVLANEAERGLTSRGIRAETIWLNDRSIRDCQGCHGCKRENSTTCIMDDDMQEIYQLMRAADGFIVTSPVYFGNVSGLTRIWLDRLVPFIGMDLTPLMPKEAPVSFIFTQNLPDTTLFEQDLRSFIRGVAMTGLSFREILIAGDCNTGIKPPVEDRAQEMDRAFRLGADLIG